MQDISCIYRTLSTKNLELPKLCKSFYKISLGRVLSLSVIWQQFICSVVVVQKLQSMRYQLSLF